MRLGALSGPRAGVVVEIGDRLTIGRAPECRLVLADPKVSRRHADLWVREGRARVRDEGSRNGTWLNDRRIVGEHRLRAGDRLRIGGSEFVVQDEGEVADAVDALTLADVAPACGTTEGSGRLAAR